MSGKGSYVWDEWSDEEPSNKKDSERDFLDEFNDTRSSFSSLGFESRTARSSVVDSVTSETLVKVKKLQAELKAKQNDVNLLHAEYKRVRAAKERRIEKCRVTMEEKLQAVREQNRAAAEKLEAIYQKLSLDVQKLREQEAGLKKRMKDNQSNQEQALEKTKRDAQKRLARAKQQWQADEAAAFEKVMKSKGEILEKQAAESLDPKLKKMVEDGKRKVSDARDSGEVRLQQMQLALKAEHERKLEEVRGKLTEQIEHDLEKVKRQLQKQQDEQLKQHQAEVAALREKFQREKLNLDEAFDRTQRLEQEQLQDALQSLSKRETLQTTELLEKQQREVGYLVETQTETVNKLKQQLREQGEQSQQRAAQLKNAFREQQLQRRKEGVTRRLAAETERILQKLRDDAEQERARLQRKYEERVNAVRDQAQRELETKQEKEHREMTRIASLNAEIETFKAQCARLQQAENAAKASLTERLLPSLSELRQDLRAIEAEFQQLAPRQEEELQARRQEKAQEIAALEGKAHSQSDALEEQRRRHAEKMEEVEQKYVADLTRIKEKVSALLRRKEATHAELSGSLYQLQSQSGDLQDTLEDLRSSALAN